MVNLFLSSTSKKARITSGSMNLLFAIINTRQKLKVLFFGKKNRKFREKISSLKLPSHVSSL